MRRTRTNTRRGFLKSAGLSVAATGLGFADLGFRQSLALAAKLGGTGLLAPLASHYPAKAKQLVILFFTGGFSQVDTFDYKPDLQKYHGKIFPEEELGWQFCCSLGCGQ